MAKEDARSQNEGPRTAVVAVHGVGEHDPGQTIDEIRRLLITTNPGAYREFSEQTLSIAVRWRAAASLSPPPEEKGWRRFVNGFGSVFAQTAKRNPTSGLVDFGPPASVDIDFMRSLLAGGEQYRSNYDTQVARGRRTGANGQSRAVDIYELYWSDLSHYGKSVTSLASALFQLIVHVSSLGRLSAAIGLKVVGNSILPYWRPFYALTAASYWLLATPIVILNFILFLLALILIPAFAANALGDVDPVVGALPIALLCAIIAAWLSYRRARNFGFNVAASAARWAPFAPLGKGLVIGVVVWLLLHILAENHVVHAAPLFWAGAEMAPVLAIGCLVMRAYDNSRPGALAIWISLTALLAIWTVMALHRARAGLPSDDGAAMLVHILGHAAEGVFFALVACWAALYAVNAALLLLSALLYALTRIQRTTDGASPDAIRRTIGTALLAASLPQTVFLATVLSAWSLFYQLLGGWLPKGLCYDPTLAWLFGKGADAQRTCPVKHALGPQDFIAQLIDRSASGSFLVFVVLTIVGLGLAVWGVGPSVIRELSPGDGAETRPSIPVSKWMGSWLDGGFVALGLGVAIVAAAFFLVLPSGAISEMMSTPPASHSSFVKWTGFLVTGSAVGLFGIAKAFAGEISDAFDRGRVVIDIALDVDNWLRERPVGQTPRLKIVSRFRSLLHEIAASKQYDRVVIVAHSQGTVIAVDTLRYLKATNDPLLGELKQICLLTAGSPLRQLYALRLPFLYTWVGRSPSSKIGPDPRACGVTKWVNVYGSADYVGRYLWLADNDSERWTPARNHPGSHHSEMCIGPEAHTHYFDKGRRMVGQKLDALI